MSAHDPKDPIGCQCEACKFMFAEADDLATRLWKSMPRCKREGCTHNNCLFVGGKCATRGQGGLCGCGD